MEGAAYGAFFFMVVLGLIGLWAFTFPRDWQPSWSVTIGIAVMIGLIGGFVGGFMVRPRPK